MDGGRGGLEEEILYTCVSVHRLYTLNGQNMTIVGVYMCLSISCDRQFKLNLVHANVVIINGAQYERKSVCGELACSFYLLL